MEKKKCIRRHSWHVPIQQPHWCTRCNMCKVWTEQNAVLFLTITLTECVLKVTQNVVPCFVYINVYKAQNHLEVCDHHRYSLTQTALKKILVSIKHHSVEVGPMHNAVLSKMKYCIHSGKTAIRRQLWGYCCKTFFTCGWALSNSISIHVCVCVCACVCVRVCVCVCLCIQFTSMLIRIFKLCFRFWKTNWWTDSPGLTWSHDMRVPLEGQAEAPWWPVADTTYQHMC